MKAAESTLTAATMRARFSAGAQALCRREGRHDEDAAGDSEAGEIDANAPGRHACEEGADILRRLMRDDARDCPAEIEREQAHHHAGDRHRQQHDAPARQEGADAGADRDRDREDAEIGRNDHFGAAHAVLHQRGQKRHHHRADQPEQRDHDAGPPQPGIAPQILQEIAGRAQDVAVDDEIGRSRPGLRDEQGRNPAGQREDQDQQTKLGGVAAFARRQAARDGAEQDRDEGRTLDQRVAGRQFLTLQMVGQDAVFDRPEQGRDHAEQAERDEQHRHGMQDEAEDSDRRCANLGELQPLRHYRLVEAVGHLAADAREQEEGRNEEPARQRHQRLAMRAGELVQDDEDQRVLEEIVVEGGEELRPEQRGEASLQHQCVEHDNLTGRDGEVASAGL
jgi:hypothetical protein